MIRFTWFLGCGVYLVPEPDEDGYQEADYGLLTEIHWCSGRYELIIARIDDQLSDALWQHTVDPARIFSIEGCLKLHPRQQVTSLRDYSSAEQDQILDWLESEDKFRLLARVSAEQCITKQCDAAEEERLDQLDVDLPDSLDEEYL